mmetsp:Transcript_112467/g.359157  ORF Transcript_112467/g.359157 Transcript_112467/m.359157 type:complete len:267 (-) Transcript_112467:40-840(-)
MGTSETSSAASPPRSGSGRSRTAAFGAQLWFRRASRGKRALPRRRSRWALWWTRHTAEKARHSRLQSSSPAALSRQVSAPGAPPASSSAWDSRMTSRRAPAPEQRARATKRAEFSRQTRASSSSSSAAGAPGSGSASSAPQQEAAPVAGPAALTMPPKYRHSRLWRFACLRVHFGSGQTSARPQPVQGRPGPSSWQRQMSHEVAPSFPPRNRLMNGREVMDTSLRTTVPRSIPADAVACTPKRSECANTMEPSVKPSDPPSHIAPP